MNIKVIKSNRKTLSLSIDDELNAVVRAPILASDKMINDFVTDNQAWIIKAAERKKSQLERYNLSDSEIQELIFSANAYIPQRVQYYSRLMHLIPSGVRITKAKKRFGSCSGKNSLCFSCFLMMYPTQAIDYVIVHELAHIKHHNHSKEFYAFVSRYMPDYRTREKLLKV